MDFELPYTIKDYLLLESLGSGSSACVYKAVHTRINQFVAIKIIPKKPSTMQFLDREISIFRSIDHPFIAQFFDKFEDEKYIFIVMEYAENGSLLDYLKLTQTCRETMVRRVFIQVIMVLEYLHNQKNIVHRDLKVENILIDKNFNIKLIDFGFANTFTDDNKMFQTSCGTVAFTAPEIIARQKYTASSDIWSAGILIYTMLVGQLPFNDQNIIILMDKIMTDEPEFPPEISEEAKDLTKRLLKKDPNERIRIEDIFKHEWIADSKEFKSITTVIMNMSLYETLISGIADLFVQSQLTGYSIYTNSLETDIKNGVNNLCTICYKILRRNKICNEIGILCRNMPHRTHGVKSCTSGTIRFCLEKPTLTCPSSFAFHNTRRNSCSISENLHMQGHYRRNNCFRRSTFLV